MMNNTKENRENGHLISIVVRVRNAVSDLERCLLGLEEQVLPEGMDLEVVVVDNESTDGSDVVAHDRGAVVISILESQFSWGRALNWGILKTRGHLVLLLSADACPADPHWVSEMIKPFTVPTVAAVYGRQLPHSNAPIDERVRLEKHFGPTYECIDKSKEGLSPTGEGMLVSNACAAIRKSIWQDVPYDEEITAGEEGVWSYDVLMRGYSIVYQPSACVYHSHKDSAFKFAWREWELFQKNLIAHGLLLGKVRMLRWLASLVKRRFVNCMWPNVPLLVRMSGLVRLPWEIIALVLVMFFGSRKSSQQKLRWLFWK